MADAAATLALPGRVCRCRGRWQPGGWPFRCLHLLVVVELAWGTGPAGGTSPWLGRSDGGFADASVAFPGVVWPTLRGLDIIDNIPSLENSSSSSERITSGPFASATAFAVARQGGFFRRLAPSRFEETQGNFPLAVFGRFTSAGPPPTARLPPDCHPPSHLRCSPRPFSGWGQTSELSWGPFSFT